MNWNVVAIVATLINCAIALRSIYLLRQIESYKESLRKLVTRMDRVEKESHP